MGAYHSVLVHPDEIPAYVQRPFFCCGLGSFWGASSSGVGLFTEPARFNEPKPYGLHPQLSDDTWAALKLRVDPLARNLLDPHRSYAGAAFLCLLMTAVFSAVRPGWSYNSLSSYYGADDDNDDDDRFDDYYRYIDDTDDGVDDVILAELSYRNEELDQALLVWRIGFYSFLAILLISTLGIAIRMEQRNAKYDKIIRSVCDEMRSRFEAEGFSVEYKTRGDISGFCFGLGQYIRPERVILFKRLFETDGGGLALNVPYVPPEDGAHLEGKENAQGDGITRSSPPNTPKRYSTLMVQVPRGYSPGQVVNVATPSGSQIMVAVPSGVRPGQKFPVQIPTQMQARQQLSIQEHDAMPAFTRVLSQNSSALQHTTNY